MNTSTSYEFKDSATLPVSKTLLIGFGGPTGGGKTESMMRVARGIVGEKDDFCVIDTENRRALNKKSRYRFKHLDLQPPYSPENYEGAIKAAIKEGFRCVVVDSFSHEWDGEGGLSDDAADILDRMSKGDAARAEKLTALAWKDPKRRHKRLMAFLRKCEIPILFGLRAEPKIKFTKDANGKTQVIDAGWLPIAEKMFGYDMLIYALMMAENPGVPVHLKKLEPEFEPMFPLGKQITEQCGRALAEWAHGGKNAAPQAPATSPAATAEPPAAEPAGAAPERISVDQQIALTDMLHEGRIASERAYKAWKVTSIRELPSSEFKRAVAWIEKVKEAS